METIRRRDIALHSALRVFCLESIALLKKTTDVSSIPDRRHYDFEADKTVPTRAPDWWQQSSYITPVLSLESLASAQQNCLSHPRIKLKHGLMYSAFNNRVTFDAAQVPIELLIECISIKGSIRYDIKTFDKVFEDLISFVSDKPHLARLIAPLDNLVCDSFRFSESMRIRRLNGRQRAHILNTTPFIGLYYLSPLQPWFACIIEYDLEFHWVWDNKSDSVPAPQYNLLDEMSKVMRDIIIIRSSSGFPITAPTFSIQYTGWSSVTLSGGVMMDLPFVRKNIGDKVELNRQQTNLVRKWYDLYLSIGQEKVRKRIFMALRKYAFALDRPYGGDRLFDYVSGLEGLLVDSSNEVAHKFSERIALLAESKADARVELQKKMKKAYQLRSKVAHGSFIIDDLLFARDTMLHKRETDQLNLFRSHNKTLHDLFHSILFFYLSKQKADFDWDKMIMSTRKGLG